MTSCEQLPSWCFWHFRLAWYFPILWLRRTVFRSTSITSHPHLCCIKALAALHSPRQRLPRSTPKMRLSLYTLRSRSLKAKGLQIGLHRQFPTKCWPQSTSPTVTVVTFTVHQLFRNDYLVLKYSWMGMCINTCWCSTIQASSICYGAHCIPHRLITLCIRSNSHRLTGPCFLRGHAFQSIEVSQSDTYNSTVLHVPDVDPVVGGDVIFGRLHQFLAEDFPSKLISLWGQAWTESRHSSRRSWFLLICSLRTDMCLATSMRPRLTSLSGMLYEPGLGGGRNLRIACATSSLTALESLSYGAPKLSLEPHSDQVRLRQKVKSVGTWIKSLRWAKGQSVYSRNQMKERDRRARKHIISGDWLLSCMSIM